MSRSATISPKALNHPNVDYSTETKRFADGLAQALRTQHLTAPKGTETATAGATAWLNWFRVAKVDNHNPDLPLVVTITLDPAEKAINLNAADYVFKDNTRATLTIKNRSAVPLFVNT